MAKQKKEAKKKKGRPCSFRDSFTDQAKKLAMLGLTNTEMAAFFGVAPSTFSKWIVDKPEFSESLKEGRDSADANVVASLYARALGYSHKDVDIRVCGGEVVKTEIMKHYPPDPTAIIFWLKNRQPQRWRDKPITEGKNEDLVAAIMELTKGLPGA